MNSILDTPLTSPKVDRAIRMVAAVVILAATVMMVQRGDWLMAGICGMVAFDAVSHRSHLSQSTR